MVLSMTQTVLAVIVGSIVGYSLGLIGGGGSILARCPCLSTWLVWTIHTSQSAPVQSR
jgi:uncharacterized membrane protein YfcA